MIEISAQNFELGILSSDTHKTIVIVPTMEIGPAQFAPIGLRFTFHVDRLAAAKIAKELSDAAGANGEGAIAALVEKEDDNKL